MSEFMQLTPTPIVPEITVVSGAHSVGGGVGLVRTVQSSIGASAGAVLLPGARSSTVSVIDSLSAASIVSWTWKVMAYVPACENPGVQSNVRLAALKVAPEGRPVAEYVSAC